MEAAYDAAQVWNLYSDLPIIDRNPRGKVIAPTAPDAAGRNKGQPHNAPITAREGFRWARCLVVRGAAKAVASMKSALLALISDQRLKTTGC